MPREEKPYVLKLLDKQGQLWYASSIFNSIQLILTKYTHP